MFKNQSQVRPIFYDFFLMGLTNLPRGQVKFPLEGLDLKPYLLAQNGDKIGGGEGEENEYIYDLTGVVGTTNLTGLTTTKADFLLIFF
jgi:hypothetical protein